MVKIDLITGFLGSGKTTFIKKYAKHLIDKGVSLVNFGMVKLCEKWYIIVCNKAKDFIVID